MKEAKFITLEQILKSNRNDMAKEDVQPGQLTRFDPFVNNMRSDILHMDHKGDNVMKIQELQQVFKISRFSISRPRIVHTIYSRIMPYEKSDLDIIKDLSVRSFYGSIFIVARHLNHYHVIHDCKWTKEKCRCLRIVQIESERQRCVKRSSDSNVWTNQHWYNLLYYLDRGARKINWLEICQDKWIRNSKNEFVSFEQNFKFTLDRTMKDYNAGYESNLYPDHEIDAEYYEIFVRSE